MRTPLLRASLASALLVASGCAPGPSGAGAPELPAARPMAGGSATTFTPEVLVVRVTGRDYQWHLDYPGPDGELGTSDDVSATRDIHVPAATQVRLELESDDYMYQVGLPHLGLSEIAVPDLHFELEFGSGPPGRHAVLGDQFCGYSHPDLLADLVVMPQADFAGWLESRAH